MALGRQSQFNKTKAAPILRPLVYNQRIFYTKVFQFL